MKIFLCLMTFVFSINIWAFTPEEAAQLMELNEKSFTQKEMINNPDLCIFHNSLIKLSKSKKDQLSCNQRKEAPPTNEDDLVKQMQNINQAMSTMTMTDQNEPATPDSIKEYAIQKMKEQGFR